MIDCLKKLSPAHIWLLSLVVSLVVMESIAGSMGLLLKGVVTFDFLLMGFVSSLFAAGLVGSSLNSFLAQQRKIEISPDSDAVIGAQKDTEVAGAVAKAGTGDAGRYVAPQDIAGCKAVEERVCTENGNADIRRAIGDLDVLPAMPAIAQRLLTLDLDTEEGQQKLLVLIEQDPQISAKILGLANSALIGASRHITTVRDAAMLLGIKRVQSVATGIAILSLMAKAPAGEFNIQDLWLHSFRIAFAVQGIARFMPAKMRPQDDQIFLACMLHDIGYLVLAYIDPGLSDKLHIRLAAEPERPVMEVEREILDVCHDELGAELALHWNLPEEIVAVLRYHHNPDAAGAAAGQPLVRMIDIAQKLLPSFGIIENATHDVGAGEWEALGISPSKAAEVKEEVGERAEQATQFASSFT